MHSLFTPHTRVLDLPNAACGGICGGTLWEKARQNDQMTVNDPKAEFAPKIIRLTHNNRDYTDELIVMRVSQDGAIGGVYVQSNEILIYRFMDRRGDLLPERTSKKPVFVHKIVNQNFKKILDLYIFKK